MDFRFAYCNETIVEDDSVAPTLYAARKYLLDPLSKECVEYLTKNAAPENVFVFLAAAEMFDIDNAAQNCWKVIDRQTTSTVQSPGFLEVNRDMLEAVLKRTTLDVDEAVLFRAVEGWSKKECERQGKTDSPENCREVLGELLHLVRMPAMKQKDFCNGAAQSGILTTQETLDMLRYFNSDTKPEIPFLKAERKPPGPCTCLQSYRLA